MINPIMGHGANINILNMATYPDANKCTNVTGAKRMHCKKIPKSAGQVGFPCGGPNFQTRNVQPMEITTTNVVIRILNCRSVVPYICVI